jgi:hypothetical protein
LANKLKMELENILYQLALLSIKYMADMVRNQGGIVDNGVIQMLVAIITDSSN